MRIITIANYKGGSGKTATAVNLAYDLAALHNKRVLLIDADPQGNASYLLSKYNNYSKSLYDALARNLDISKVVSRTKYENLDIVTASLKLEDLNVDADDVKRALVWTMNEDLYDYVIIDNRPAVNKLAFACMAAADDIVVPVEVDQFSFNGISFMAEQIEKIENFHNENIQYSCLITKYKWTKASVARLRELITKYDYPIYTTVIEHSSTVPSSTFARKPLLRHRRNDRATLEYMAFTEEYLKSVGDLDA